MKNTLIDLVENINVETAPTSASKCRCCKKLIKKEEKRLDVHGVFNSYLTHKFYCKKCAKKLLKRAKDTINTLLLILN